MHHNSLFNRPRIRLSLLYAIVMGGILLSLGYGAHRVVERSVSRMVDRELQLLAATLNARLLVGLQGPGQLAPNAAILLPELCLADQPCPPKTQNSPLLKLIQADYSLQLLDLQGRPIAAIGESPDRFGPNPQLREFYTVQDGPQGDAYHLHLMPLQTQQGRLWGYLQVGRSVQKFDDYMRGLHLLILVGVPTAMVMIGAASWALAGAAMRPIYQAYGQMQQFTANAAHELRTPIAAIRAIVEVAMVEDESGQLEARSGYPQPNPQTLQALHRQADRLGRLAQDLLLLSRLDARPDALPPEAAPICLNDLVEDLEEELMPVAMSAGVDLGRDMQTEAQLMIQGNSNQIYRLVSNLVTNAIQHSPRGGKVTIQLARHQKQATIAVQDWGAGIAAAELPHLFDRFHRVAADRSRQTGGAGLGLAIAQAIAQAHRGQIRVQSQVGQGSTFTVELPITVGALVKTRPDSLCAPRLN
jgi:signal transduction histidine kinase